MTMTSFNKRAALEVVALVLAAIIGIAGLLVYFTFVFSGPLDWVDLDLIIQKDDAVAIVAFDTLLSFLFFVQHSGMIRLSFKQYLLLHWKIPNYMHGAIFSFFSGVSLLVVMTLWQRSNHELVLFRGWIRVLMRVVFAIGTVGFYWVIQTLKNFDVLGVDPLLLHIRQQLQGKGKKEEEPIVTKEASKVEGCTPKAACPLAIRGPYGLVRHPLYLFSIVMIWSFPDLTVDRLLFNILWTCWIAVGTHLEEKDLIAVFGDSYRKYQEQTPMLLPTLESLLALRKNKAS
jgi:methanethiol S-methyltransferase